MNNIIKASLYKLYKGKELKYCLLFSVILGVAFGIAVVKQNYLPNEILTDLSGKYHFFGYLICISFVCSYLGGDFKNKNIHNLIMQGNQREKIYIAKLLTCILCVFIVLNIFLIAYLIPVSFKYNLLIELGNGFIIKYLFAIFFGVVSIAFSVAVMLLVQNVATGMILCWTIFAISVIPSFFDLSGNAFLGYPILSLFGIKTQMTVLNNPINIGGLLLLVATNLSISLMISFIGSKLFTKLDIR